MISTQKSINHHLSISPRHPIIHHQDITSMREIWSPKPPISMSSQSPATGAWAWASLGGGEKKIACHCQFHEHFSFFWRPPPSPLEVAQVLEIVEIMDFIIANSTTISYIPLVCLKTQLSVPASTCIYCRLYVVRVDTYIVWFQ